MTPFDHLKLLPFQPENNRKKRKILNGFSPYPTIKDRNKEDFYIENLKNLELINNSYEQLKSKYKDKINPNLIFKLKINHKIDFNIFNKELFKMDIDVLNISDNEKAYWIVFGNEDSLIQFNTKMEKYVDGSYPFFNVIDTLEDIDPNDKIGEYLKQRPLEENVNEYLNVELWRMEDEKINEFLDQINDTFPLSGFKILDKLITKSFVLLRVNINKKNFKELLKFKEVAKIERPFFNKLNPSKNKEIDINDCKIVKPKEDACGILIIDSGLISNHPLLESAIKYEENFQTGEVETHDTVGHGTAVGGNCIYGDIDKCIDDKLFYASNYLFSAKVMYAEKFGTEIFGSAYDQEKLVENQFKEAIDFFLTNEELKIKVVNISIGNIYEVWDGKLRRQFPLASLIDEIAIQYPNIIFVVSTGNAQPTSHFDNLADIINKYPDYLYDDLNFKIINPATSSLSITVGSLAPTPKIFFRDNSDIWYPIAMENEPSPFTRTGAGINKAIKPELVEYGGNLICNELAGQIRENIGSKLSVLSNNISSELFRYDYGSSFSAPKISNIIGKVGNYFPNASANFIKNLILQSANNQFNIQFKGTKPEKIKKNLYTIGYGLPKFESAIFSTNNRVLLFDENEIGLDKVMCYSLNLPEIFIETKGRKKISVVLIYNPITKATRGDSYFGNILEFRLFANIDSNIIFEANSLIENISDEHEYETETQEDINLKIPALELVPSSKIRSSTCHQKGSIIFKRKKIGNPLTLILFNKNKWISNKEYKQSYCISIMIEHEEEIDLYSELRTKVQVRSRVK